MKIKHRVPTFGPKSAALTPEYQREVDATMQRAEAAWKRSQRRLDKAVSRLAEARRGAARRRVIVELEALVELRRIELQQTHRLMVATGFPSPNRGRRSHRHLNMGEVL